MTLYSSAEAAAQIGCDPATCRRACAAHGIGAQVSGAWVLTPADVARLRTTIRPARGNPAFAPGNYFGGAKKQPKASRKKSRK